MFGILGAIVAIIMAYASVQMERMEREISLINQEAYAHVNRN